MKYKITFLLDKSNDQIKKQLINYNFKLSHKYIFKITNNINSIKNQNIIFPLNYTKILSKSFLLKNNLVLIIHSSQLPKDRGFAPIQNQILKDKNRIYISLMKAIDKVDAGPIYFQNSFMLNGTELSDKIKYIQGRQMIKIIKKFLVKYPNVKSRKQIGKSNFNKRRNPKDSQLDINKTIKQQFNNLRINDNKLYPSFFHFKGKKYIIKIFDE